MFLPLTLDLRVSRLALGVQSLAHALAASGLWLSAATLPLCLLGSAALGLSLARQVRRARPPEALSLDKAALRIGAAGEWLEARLEGAYVSSLLVVLRLDAGGRRRHVVLWPDSADAEGLRRLRAWLNWGREAAGLRTRRRQEARRIRRGRSDRDAG